MSTRKRRETVTPRTEDIGPLWMVRGGGNEEHVRASTVAEAILVFVEAVEASTGVRLSPELVTFVQRVAVTVHSIPKARGGSDGEDK